MHLRLQYCLFFIICFFLTVFPKERIEAAACNEESTCSCEEKGKVQIYGEFLYWKVVQDQMQYAAILPGGVQGIIQNVQQLPITLSESVSVIDPSFKYKPGFRVGVGYSLPGFGWDFQLNWVRLHEKISSRVSDKVSGVIPLTIPASSVFGFINKDPSQFGFGNKATSSWHFAFDTLDFQVGRSYVCSDCAVVRPYIGVKGASIKQHQDLEYFGFVINNLDVLLHNRKTNNFHGIGPSFGFDLSWEFYRGFSLTSGVCGALLLGKLDVKENPSVEVDPNSIDVTFRNSKKHRLRPALDARIGIDWNTCFCNKFQVNVGVFYEVQYWWNQWQVSPSVESGLLTGGASYQGDLMMQGLTARLGILF